MSWLFSQALVEEYSAGTSLAGQPCVQLSVMPTPHKFWRNDKTIESCDHSRFGLTSQVLTDDRGAELLTSFLAASHARTSARPVRASASPAHEVAYGSTWRGSLAKFDRDLSMWKTAQGSLLEDSAEFLATWPRWGTTQNGALYLREIPALSMSANASGLWPTPTASLAKNGGRITPRKGREGGTLIEALSARMYPTPTAGNKKSGGTMQEWGGSKNWVRTEDPDLARGLLNPEWVEWLMGWPIGWTELKPLEMDKFQEWQRQHSICFVGDELKTSTEKP